MRRDATNSLSAMMVAAAWMGLLAGALDLLAVVLVRSAFGQFAFVGRNVWWTAPLVNLLLFGALGAALAVAAHTWPHAFWWRMSVWVFAFLGCLGALRMFVGIHRVTVWIASAGVATQVARVALAHREAFVHLARRTTPWLLAGVVATACTVHGEAWWQERRALAALPAASPGAPNVLLIVLDTVRAANLSLYGYPRETTPHLQARAAGGAVFTEAFSTAPWTLPSHASMLTGRLQPELSTDWMRPLDERDPTLAEALAARGYATGGFVANVYYASAEVGLARGFAHFEDYGLTAGQIARSSSLGRAIDSTPAFRRVFGEGGVGQKRAPDISTAFLAWTSAQGDRPWFAMLNYYDAHRPYTPPEPFFSRFATPQVPPDPHVRFDDAPHEPWTGADGRRFQVAYDGALAYLDAEMETLFQALGRRGEQTIIIIASDHGEEFGEHRLWGHGSSLDLPSLHVPLVILGPGVTAGTVVRTPVSLRDVPATVLDLIGNTGRAEFPGRSLARFWKSADASSLDNDLVVSGVLKTPGHPDWYPVSRGDLISLIRHQLHYVRNLGDGTEELFDFRADRWERRDLVDDEAYRPVLERFRGESDRFSRRQ